MSALDKNLFRNYGVEFCECSIRRAFVKKVFGIVTIMLAFVAIMCAIPFMSEDFGSWLRGETDDDGTGAAIFNIVVCCVFIVLSITLACVPKLTRMVPLNYFLLLLFTLSAGAMLMCVTAFFTFSSVMLSMIMTAGCCAAVVIFAIFVNKDLTTMMGFMFLFGMWLFFFGLIASISIWAFNVEYYYTLYAALITFFFLLWLAIDIQLVMGGGRYELSPEEYIFAAMIIFLDIINIFLYILAIFGKVR